jgi:hypothetical protein
MARRAESQPRDLGVIAEFEDLLSRAGQAWLAARIRCAARSRSSGASSPPTICSTAKAARLRRTLEQR